MRAATVHEIKQELITLQPKELVELCLRLSRFKKENKELLTYLLFEAHNEPGYVAGVKEELLAEFASINLSHVYYAKKSLRKIVRIINKYSRYSAEKTTEIELRLFFCQELKSLELPLQKSTVIYNLYLSQWKKSKQLLASLHEDLQYDYKKLIDELAIV